MKRVINKMQVTVFILSIFFFIGCASPFSTSKKEAIDNDNKENIPHIVIHEFKGDTNKNKNIFVFLDGTENEPQSYTNIWRLYELITDDNNPQMTAIYIEGVGSNNEAPVSGAILGRGMENRMLKGYKFIIQNYKPNDNIYIFGFSRGAHQARSLAGFIAYAGIPVISNENDEDLIKIGNDLLDLTKKKKDEDYADKWKLWKPKQQPLLSKEIKDSLNIKMQTAEINFLGIWDTVPGSSFKTYRDCKEKIGFLKKNLFWVPVIDKGDRYKSDSYPAIRQIAHAVALDEKRSKFRTLLICKPINPKYTKLNEVWFPGAHADVGGGYKDFDGNPELDLPGISLNWMIDLLAQSYKFKIIPKVKENAKGLAHHSIDDFPANIGSYCEDRILPDRAIIHPSFEDRKKSSPVPIIKDGKRKFLSYPIKCPIN